MIASYCVPANTIRPRLYPGSARDVYSRGGRTTFGVPDLEARVSIHQGSGPGLTNRRLGESGGVATVTLTEAQMPRHTHQLQGDEEDATRNLPQDQYPAVTEATAKMYAPLGAGQAMAPQCLDPLGGGQAHNNLQPLLVLNYCIALIGVFPTRN